MTEIVVPETKVNPVFSLLAKLAHHVGQSISPPEREELQALLADIEILATDAVTVADDVASLTGNT